MKWKLVLLLLMMGMTRWRCWVRCTCVFESDFGFQLNCGFKKSSLFRVRNLGGVKSYFGLGFSLGDELGFRESLSNLESTNRRSVVEQDSRISSGRSAQAGYFQQLYTTSTTTSPDTLLRNIRQNNGSIGWPVGRSANGRSSNNLAGAINLRAPGSRYSSVPLINPVSTVVVPPFKPIHPAESFNRPTLRLNPQQNRRYNNNINNNQNNEDNDNNVIAVPAFAALPDSIAKVALQTTTKKKLQQQTIDNNLSNNRRLTSSMTGDVPDGSTGNDQQQIFTNSVSPHYIHTADPDTNKILSLSNNSLSELIATKDNDSLLASIRLLQQQQTNNPSTTTTSKTTVTESTAAKATTSQQGIIGGMLFDSTISGSPKVMNAPKEYYPVSYEKNFDDNFRSRVELPETSFNCGHQKHFPGLYADQHLNCMVFHVCALTDDGLVQKSFLCPESTLFDQSILKCNWWFYVDCKASEKLYDSNIPVSKTYQLMKALAFFSAYSKEQQLEHNQNNNSTTVVGQ